MKNVIVGIDFSPCSLNAMKHAVALAANLKASLTLLFVVSPDEKLVIDASPKDKSDIITFAEQKLTELVAGCKKYLPADAKIQYKIRMGKPSREINTEARNQGNAITVLGTHGCTGFEEFFMGSSAFKTVSGASNPVLTIREGVSINRDLTDILLPIDDSLETLQKLKPATILAKAFQAKIHLMGFHSGNYPEIKRVIDAYIQKATMYLTENNVRFEVIDVDTSNKVGSTIQIAKDRNINLIIVMKEVESAGENIFIMAPFSEKLVNRSPIPILTVPIDSSIYPKR